MEMLAAGQFSLTSQFGLVGAAIGLGFVIFIHELGHFLVAKWCGVKVERFSIGFGPILWGFKKGDTEYALSVIPLGGYVKMLGQDDADPSQMTDAEVARDPKSYTAKSVPQRIAIISAGVIMNILTAPLFFAFAGMLGVRELSPVIGATLPGSPAWEAGLLPGDEIVQINGKSIQTFLDVSKRVALSQGQIDLVVNREGKRVELHLVPSNAGELPSIGALSSRSLKIVGPAAPAPDEAKTAPVTSSTGLQDGDVITAVNGESVKDHAQLKQLLSKLRAETLDVTAQRGDATVKVELPPIPFRGLGIWTDIGRIAKVRRGSVAEGQLEIGDRITHLIDPDGTSRELGRDISPLQLPDLLAGYAGKSITLKLKREIAGADAKEISVSLTPTDEPGWLEPPMTDDSPLAAPAIGISYYVMHHVLAVDPAGPAHDLVKQNDRLEKIEFVLPAGAPQDDWVSKKELSVEFGEKKRNWPIAFWLMQQYPTREAKLTIISGGKTHTVTVSPQDQSDWYLPERRLDFGAMESTRHLTDPVEALSYGWSRMTDTVNEIYMTLYSLFSGSVSPKNLSGPFGIIGQAAKESAAGLSPLLFFLGYLSVNLAVVNFLPIPLLDGGHMMFLLYEGVRGKPASERIQVTAIYLGIAFLLSLVVFVTFMDISRFWVKSS